ncbi:oligosaccharide flippase family protein [Candidatus Microgenomates bacterium]|nr:oligosaccharide flippase family protein [Candidatus Microgenomates bacterium]
MEEEHLDPTTEISLDTVKKRAVKGVAVLTGRTFLLSVLSLVATGFLTVFLSPVEFGVFWIVSAVVNFLAYFSDVGLAAALIQKREKLTNADLKTTFTVQTILVILILAILLSVSPLIVSHYSLSVGGKYLLFALAISLFLSSLKTIPSILMERDLEFGKLVIPQVLENLVYNLVAVILAWKGFGITSFTIAVLARGVVGLVAMYFLKPWKPAISFNKKSFKDLLSFGIPYQANTLLATLKDDGMTVVLGSVLGPAGIGLLGWAQKWGQAPLRFFMDHVIKVTFPAFSRMQDEKEHLKRSLTRSIFFICFLVFPSVVGLLMVAPVIVAIIPRYEKWVPALIPLAFISVNSIFAAVTTQLTNTLNAIGKIKITFGLMIMWTVLSWIFIPYMALKYGVNGAAAGYSIVGLSSIVAIFVARKFVDFSLMESVLKPLLAAFVMMLPLIFLRRALPASLGSVWILVATGAIIYLSVIFALYGLGFIEDVKNTFSAFFKK